MSRIPLAGVLMVTAVRMVPGEVVRRVLTSSRSGAATSSDHRDHGLFDLIVAVGIGIAFAALFVLGTLARCSGVREQIAGPANHLFDDLPAAVAHDGEHVREQVD